MNNLFDHELTAEQLDDKYNPDGDGEHPKHPQEEWRDAVNAQQTLLGYWEWLKYKLIEDSETQEDEEGYTEEDA